MLHVIPYNGSWGGLMSCDVLVMSKAGVKLYRCRLTETLLKLKHHLVLTTGNIMLASYVTNQSSHLTTDISHGWVEWFYSVLGEQQGVGNYWNGNLAFGINASNHICHAHMTDNQVKVLEDCKNEVSCEVCNLNAQDIRS